MGLLSRMNAFMPPCQLPSLVVACSASLMALVSVSNKMGKQLCSRLPGIHAVALRHRQEYEIVVLVELLPHPPLLAHVKAPRCTKHGAAARAKSCGQNSKPPALQTSPLQNNAVLCGSTSTAFAEEETSALGSGSACQLKGLHPVEL